jgi:hypothetical protein
LFALLYFSVSKYSTKQKTLDVTSVALRGSVISLNKPHHHRDSVISLNKPHHHHNHSSNDKEGPTSG